VNDQPNHQVVLHEALVVVLTAVASCAVALWRTPVDLYCGLSLSPHFVVRDSNNSTSGSLASEK
jgi:hypothetical protein